MSTWLTIPSKRPPDEANPVLQLWRARGYKIALHCDSEVDAKAKTQDVYMTHLLYPGYSIAVNALIESVRLVDETAEWFVIGGDDIEPDPNKSAEEIARECFSHFRMNAIADCLQGKLPDLSNDGLDLRATFGVMQPTGDRFAGGEIDRICGSAWIGREFARRINQGNGPLWPEYTHMFEDEELQCVAEKYGVFWQRPDLVHLHRHFMRESDAIDSPAVVRPTPPHLTQWRTAQHWNDSKVIFMTRKNAGFPRSEPL